MMTALFFATIVVMSNPADHTDAARLQQLVEAAVRSTAPVVVTINYYGVVNAKVLPPLHVQKDAPNQLVFAAFTITDANGRVLDSAWIRYDPMLDRLTQLHKTADAIAKSVP